jgi:uncharacterized protein YbdZ (MbtH family)
MKIEIVTKFLSWECKVNGEAIPFYVGRVISVTFFERQYVMFRNRFINETCSIYESRLPILSNENIPYSIWDDTGHISRDWELVAAKSRTNCWTLSVGQKFYEHNCPKYWRNEKGYIMMSIKRRFRHVSVLSLLQRICAPITAYAKNSYINQYPVLMPMFLMSIIGD